MIVANSYVALVSRHLSRIILIIQRFILVRNWTTTNINHFQSSDEAMHKTHFLIGTVSQGKAKLISRDIPTN